MKMYMLFGCYSLTSTRQEDGNILLFFYGLHVSLTHFLKCVVVYEIGLKTATTTTTKYDL